MELAKKNDVLIVWLWNNLTEPDEATMQDCVRRIANRWAIELGRGTLEKHEFQLVAMLKNEKLQTQEVREIKTQVLEGRDIDAEYMDEIKNALDKAKS